jgi:hypothetical protein
VIRADIADYFLLFPKCDQSSTSPAVASLSYRPGVTPPILSVVEIKAMNDLETKLDFRE